MISAENTIDALATAFAEGTFTSAELCRLFLDRIEEIDRSGPTLRAVIEVNPDALAIAQALDEERGRRGPRGPLHGVPIMVKDSIDTGDQMQTTAGSLVMEGHRAEQDAFSVAQLRRAGAVILAKTNMSEWGYMRSTRGCAAVNLTLTAWLTTVLPVEARRGRRVSHSEAHLSAAAACAARPETTRDGRRVAAQHRRARQASR